MNGGVRRARWRRRQVEKRLKALPDFGNAGVWADDDAADVPEAFAPIKDVNGAEAKFLLRFLFKRAAMFRESDVKAATQVRDAAPALPLALAFHEGSDPADSSCFSRSPPAAGAAADGDRGAPPRARPGRGRAAAGGAVV